MIVVFTFVCALGELLFEFGLFPTWAFVPNLFVFGECHSGTAPVRGAAVFHQMILRDERQKAMAKAKASGTLLKNVAHG
jgi:hypothetical protein